MVLFIVIGCFRCLLVWVWLFVLFAYVLVTIVCAGLIRSLYVYCLFTGGFVGACIGLVDLFYCLLCFWWLLRLLFVLYNCWDFCLCLVSGCLLLGFEFASVYCWLLFVVLCLFGCCLLLDCLCLLLIFVDSDLFGCVYCCFGFACLMLLIVFSGMF